MHGNEMTNQKSIRGLSGIISNTQTILETPLRRFVATTRVDKQPFACPACSEVCAYEVNELSDKPNSLIAYVRPLCACEREARDIELEAEGKRQLEAEMSRRAWQIGQWRNESGLEGELADKRFDDFMPWPGQEYMLNSLQHALRQWPGVDHGLILRGTQGCGKSSASAAMVNAFIECGTEAKFRTTTQILDSIRGSYDPRYKGTAPLPAIARTPVLVIDELGGEAVNERNREWVCEQLLSLIDSRVKQKSTTLTVVTTNLSGAEMAEHYGGSHSAKRIVSRLAELGEWVEVEASDYRKEIQRGYQDGSRWYLYEN
jgi:DNA replication protein DnaC